MACRLSYHEHTVFTRYMCLQTTPAFQFASTLLLDSQALGFASKPLRSAPQVSSHGWLRPLRLRSWIGAGT
jgi:hypothetical protein